MCPRKRDRATSSNSLLIPTSPAKACWQDRDSSAGLWRAGGSPVPEVVPSPGAHAHPLELSQRPGHADDKLVKAPQLLQQYHRSGCDVQTQVLPNLVQVKDLGHLVLNVLGHLTNVVITADAAAGLPWKDDILRDWLSRRWEFFGSHFILGKATSSTLCP